MRSVYQGLQRSLQEQDTITELLKSIEQKFKDSVNHFGRDVILAAINLLPASIDRIFCQQFPVVRAAGSDLLAKMKKLLKGYFLDETNVSSGLPTGEFLASKLFMSPHYFSDSLRKLAG